MAAIPMMGDYLEEAAKHHRNGAIFMRKAVELYEEFEGDELGEKEYKLWKIRADAEYAQARSAAGLAAALALDGVDRGADRMAEAISVGARG